ncbi:MAG: hypothetical protein BroJett030_28390 [Alphaproteobacteria bacterium]|nr:MAG: hypothetical protein BroJett030_28390 [Alphaproteobacteria bacterium]
MQGVAQARAGGGFAELLARELAADRALYLAIGAYCAATVALLAATGNAHLLAHGQYLESWPLVFAVAMPATVLAAEFWLVAMRGAVGRAWGDVGPARPDLSARRLARLAAGVVLMQAFGLFTGSFTSLKNALPAWRGGFGYDAPLADLDRWLHGGADPAAALAAIGIDGWLFALIEANYSQAWFVVVYGALFLVAISPAADRVRLRFAVAFMATWVVCGNLFAGAFMSAGPVYFAEVTGDSARFAPLMAYLAGGDGTATALYRGYLWQAYLLGEAGLGTGISAFPSVHVGAVFLIALFAAERGPLLGLVAGLYAGLVLFSSVLLGWHYAVDGYFSIVAVVLIWLTTRRLAAPAKAAGKAVAGGRVLS